MSKLILATSEFCAPCKMIKQRIADLNLDVEIKDLVKDSAFFVENNIRSVPTLVMDNGELVRGAEDILTHLSIK